MEVEMKLFSYLKLALAYFKLNVGIHSQYKAAFAWQFLAMVLNNCTWLAFWLIFFERFPIIKGWGRQDILTLWSLTSAGFGLSTACFYNLHNLALLIARGELDVWLTYPRNAVAHLALAKMSPTALGDLCFGYIVYLALVRLDAAHLLAFIVLTINIALVFIGFNLMRGSLGFYFAQAEAISEQWFFAMITFSTYPSCLFEGLVKLILFTLIPAGLVSGLPVEALGMKELRADLIGLSFLGALAILAAGIGIFNFGLRSYQSGNLIEMRN